MEQKELKVVIPITKKNAYSVIMNNFGRPAFRKVCLDVEKKQIVMTDGKILIVIKVEIDEDVQNELIKIYGKTILINPDILPTKKKIKTELYFEGDNIRAVDYKIRKNYPSIRMDVERINKIPTDIKFPDYDRVFPTSDIIRKLAIDFNLIKRFANACPGNDNKFILEIREDLKEPIMVRPYISNIENEDVHGLIMPLRLHDEQRRNNARL